MGGIVAASGIAVGTTGAGLTALGIAMSVKSVQRFEPSDDTKYDPLGFAGGFVAVTGITAALVGLTLTVDGFQRRSAARALLEGASLEVTPGGLVLSGHF